MSLALASPRPVAKPARRARCVGDLAAPPRASRPAWMLAAVAAAVLHLAIAAFFLLRPAPQEADPDPGAPAMEIALELAAPRVEQTDLPPGPEAEDAAASTARMQQQAEVEDRHLPQDAPTETPDPDRVVAPEPAKDVRPDEARPEAKASTAAAASVASEAAAPPPIAAAAEAPRSTAPSIGTGDSARKVIAGWQRELVTHLDRRKRYPAGAQARDAEILIGFTIDRRGHVLGATVLKGSGDAAFDAAALDMLHRADPVPPPPALIADEGLTFKVPVVFRAKGRR